MLLLCTTAVPFLLTHSPFLFLVNDSEQTSRSPLDLPFVEYSLWPGPQATPLGVFKPIDSSSEMRYFPAIRLFTFRLSHVGRSCMDYTKFSIKLERVRSHRSVRIVQSSFPMPVRAELAYLLYVLCGFLFHFYILQDSKRSNCRPSRLHYS